MFETFILSLISGASFKAAFLVMTSLCCLVTLFHIVIYKKEPRAAVGWFVVVLSAPLLGSLTYLVFGINRIQRKAVKLNLGVNTLGGQEQSHIMFDAQTRSALEVGEALSYSPFCPLEEVQPLNTGDEAYPIMIEAINNAKVSISLLSYIFRVDQVGQEFTNALGRAKKRGVEIRVLVDGVGSKSTLNQLSSELERLEIDFHVFLPVLWRPRLVNMRNHRKILVVDAEIAFTGGLNIAEIYWPLRSSREKVLDYHFRFEGPIVNYIQAVFADDWYYCSKKTLKGDLWFKQREHDFETSDEYARVVVGGPGLNNDKIQWHFINLLNRASKKIRISSPYFLPSTGVSTALIAAAQRGVQIDIVIPGKTDHALINWATRASLEEFLKFGCRIWFSPSPFDHSKLFVIDDKWCSIGSSNWDVRSLRLNYEMNVEIYSTEISNKIQNAIETKRKRSRLYTMKDYEKRSMFQKIRDGFARMASPYL